MNADPFLKTIASYLLKSGKNDLSSTCVVFPNKRARIYLSRYMGELTDKPVWAPRYFTISEMMEKVSGYCIADKTALIFELFEVYRKVTGSSEPFDTFYPYCETLLSDFDEIDKYQVPADDLFQNLAGLKSMENKFNYLTDEQVQLIRQFWNTFNPDKISSSQQVFISLWDSLPLIYQEFRNRLLDKGLAYEGMAYRKAVENASDKPGQYLSFERYVFVGFNALNACEEKLFRLLKNRNTADFFWDYDEWYTNTEIHEAGFFIRRNIREFPQPIKPDTDMLSKPKNKVLFVPVASNSGQASVLPNIFRKLNIPADSPDRTAVVLADESLLIPVLYSIPDSVNDINVTMGYPMSGSAVFSLVDSLYELIKNARLKEEITAWYFRDVLAIMANPMLKFCYGSRVDAIRQEALDHHLVYIPNSDLVPEGETDIVFNPSARQNVCSYLLEIFTAILSQDSGKGNAEPIMDELLFEAYNFMVRLNDLMASQSPLPGYDVQFRLIRNMLRGMHVAFTGEPLAGLQLLGLLETRTLDFDNVIILSANEGVLPRSSDKPSFIPYNLRAGFGLPTPDHDDAMYAYYFYRLIQRASNLAFVYDSGSGGLKSGERSRFLHQLFYEMHLPVEELVIEASIARIPVKPIVIPHSESIRTLLLRYTGENGKILSPSAINEFLNCSVRFYFHHICGLQEPDVLTEEMDARLFGNILHRTLKIMYDGFQKGTVTEEKITAILNNPQYLNRCLDEAFNAELFHSEGQREPEGYNLIIKQVLLLYLRQFLQAEKRSCPFTIIGLEERYAVNIPVQTAGSQIQVRVGGVIDRIDRRDGYVRILDYKTGTVKNRFDSLVSLFRNGEKTRNDAVFQVLLYSLIYKKQNPSEKVLPGLFFMRNSHDPDFSPFIHMSSVKSIIEDFAPLEAEFESHLKEILARMFHPETSFVQTENRHTCNYCAYAGICRKEKTD